MANPLQSLVSFSWLTAALCGVLVSPISAEKVDYRQVRSILVKRCYRCHSHLEQESELRLDTRKGIAKGGSRGPLLQSGKSKHSRLIQVLRGEGDLRMPPEGPRLSVKQIDLIARWIDQGAIIPEENARQDHWAFSDPRRAPLPTIKRTAWARNPVDLFIGRHHDKRRLAPVPTAAPRVLLRRLYLDLIGVPPTPEQLNRFLADRRPGAYERVVEELLANPMYGERWGRHWMDVWRYSDWSGYRKEVRNSQPHIWRWRDWIIESLNAGKGYDRMILEMLAADEIAPGDPQALPATGFLARNWYKFNRNVWLENTVDHTSKAFLGFTVGCARCHNHMYDPISQEEYYGFRAIFEPYQVRADALPDQPDIKLDGIVRAYDADLAVKTYLFKRGDERHPDKSRAIPPRIPAFFGDRLQIQPVSLPLESFYPALRAPRAADITRQAEQSLAAAQAERQAAERLRDERQAKTKVASKTKGSSASRGVPAFSFVDDFSSAKKDHWKTDGGAWKYADGRVTQTQLGDLRRALRSIDIGPRDFRAKLKLTILGGQRWKSVGISFDEVAGGNDQTVYLSAFSGGPKVQVSYREKAKSVYPPNGARPLAIQVNQPYTLEVVVRDRLLNVLVNGKLQLAYRLPQKRRAGRFSIWTFDAQAAFDEFALRSLLPADKLVAASSSPTSPARPTRESLQLILDDAAKKVEKAKAHLASVVARLAAERARFSRPVARNLAALSSQAAVLDHRSLKLDAEWDRRMAQRTVQSTRKRLAAKPGNAALKKTLKAAEKQLAEADKRLTGLAADKNPTNYRPLGTKYPATSSGRRAALAKWIANRRNPLTARVAVNQIWMRHLGRPLVERVFDFGRNSPAPTHPQLLDWLAIELMDNGWNMKVIHRWIVTSATYRAQSSDPIPSAVGETVTRDRDNHYYWRQNSRRMEAEVVRDSVLAVAGQLDRTMGGPEIDHQTGQTTQRRSVYYRHAYEKQMEFLRQFDVANVEECYRRAESIVPQQALALANSVISQEQSRRLAARLIRIERESAAGDSRTGFVELAFLHILGRPAKQAERKLCRQFLIEQAERFADPGKLTAFTSGVNAQLKPSADPRQRARENLVHVLLNHNEFVTIR